MIKRKAKQRLAKQAALEAKEAAGDFSHLKNKQGQIVGTVLPKPTLPNVSLDDEEVKPQRPKMATPAPSWPPTDYSSTDYASTVNLDYPDYPPPMPEYQPYSHALPPQGQYHGYAQSVGTLPQDEGFDKYDEAEYGSTYHLTSATNTVPPTDVVQHQNSISPYPNPYAAPNPYEYSAHAQYPQAVYGNGGAAGGGYDYGAGNHY